MTVTDVSLLGAALAAQYTLERELGRGGMATVYLAQDRRYDRRVALKVLHPDLGVTLGPERFQREIRLAARLTHPHILPVLDSGEAAGRLWYAMPYVDGETLRARLEREAQLGVAEAVGIARQVAGALGYAHGQGVVHRDIKPENILLCGEQTLVADFGIAKLLDASGEKLTETGLSLGTPAYMSPEQGSGGRVDARSDVYALGCVVYEMLAGAPPFTGPTAQAILARHAVDPVPPLRTVRSQIPSAVELAVAGALAKVPADRFAGAEEFARALEADPVSPAPLPWTVAGALQATVVLLAVGGMGLGALNLRRPSDPSVLPSASTIAVLPLAAAAADTELTRLGRDLAVTISASLDGVGSITTADRLSVATATAHWSALSASDGAELARRLGATSMLRGTVVGAGQNVRIDVGLYDVDGLAPIAGGITASGHRDSIGPLTDSVAWALLRQVWQRGTPPSPSLDAVTTRSLPALRAFLQGERLLGANQWDEALLAYRSAIAADSSFALAAFRYALSLWWSNQPVEPEVLDGLRRRQRSFPERERLLLEAFLAVDRTPEVKIRQHALVTQRFPEYWPGWFLYADALYHWGPIAGHDWREGLDAFRHVLELNPTLVPAWEHSWDLARGRDRAEAAGAFVKLTQLGWLENQPPGGRFVSRLQDVADSSGGRPGPDIERLLDSFARFMPSPRRAITLELQLELEPAFLLEAGYPALQYDLNRRAVATGKLAPKVLRGFRSADARIWATRGRWDSALTILSGLAAAQPGPSVGVPGPERLGYRLAVIGAWLGATPPGMADARRSAAVAAIEDIGEESRRQMARADIAWLDGILGFVRRDRRAIQAAKREADTSGWYQTPLVQRSLEAFDRALAGDRRSAGRRLAELEQHCVDHEDCNSWVPHFAVQRMAAAQWLLEAGAADEARRLMRWQDAPWPGCQECMALAGPSLLTRARIEMVRGDSASGRDYYRRALRILDRPMPSLAHLAAEARSALERPKAEP